MSRYLFEGVLLLLVFNIHHHYSDKILLPSNKQ